MVEFGIWSARLAIAVVSASSSGLIVLSVCARAECTVVLISAVMTALLFILFIYYMYGCLPEVPQVK